MKPHCSIDPDYPDPAYAWYVVGILFLAYTLSFVDRQIMSLLIEPIKKDLHISDTMISLLHGFAFAIFYTILGIPLGRLADRRKRTMIISVGVFLWSIMTAVCGLAGKFWHLFLARIGVGVGEATLSPAAYSLISDYFPKEKRGLAISLYSMGVFFGAGMAYILGGLVVRIASRATEIMLPFIGQVQPWQLTFFIVGLPGILVMMLMFTIKEPLRRDVLVLAEKGGADNTNISIKETFRFVLSHWKTYGTLLLGFSLMGTLTYGFFSWIPSLFIRTYGWTASEIGFSFGWIVLIMGTFGIVLGGILADRELAKGKKDAFLRVAIAAAVGVPLFGIPATFMSNPEIALALLGPAVCFLGLPVGLAPAAINFITPNQMRGQVIALYLFALNLIGLGLGPTAVAVITDYVFKDDQALRYSLATFTVIVAFIAFLALVFGLKLYRKSAEALQKF